MPQGTSLWEVQALKDYLSQPSEQSIILLVGIWDVTLVLWACDPLSCIFYFFFLLSVISLVLQVCGPWSFDLWHIAVKFGGHISYVSIVICSYGKTISLNYGQLQGKLCPFISKTIKIANITSPRGQDVMYTLFTLLCTCVVVYTYTLFYRRKSITDNMVP